MKNISLVEKTIFSSRWLICIMSLGLGIGLSLYTYKFCEELFHMAISIREVTSEAAMLSLLGLVDIAMVANLVIMIAIGGYSIFVREINPNDISNRPRFMNHITASGLKVKMGSSLIGVSSIHLLKRFIETAEEHGSSINWNTIGILLAIHGIFVVSTIALAYVDRPHPTPEQDNTGKEHHA